MFTIQHFKSIASFFIRAIITTFLSLFLSLLTRELVCRILQITRAGNYIYMDIPSAYGDNPCRGVLEGNTIAHTIFLIACFIFWYLIIRKIFIKILK